MNKVSLSTEKADKRLIELIKNY